MADALVWWLPDLAQQLSQDVETQRALQVLSFTHTVTKGGVWAAAPLSVQLGQSKDQHRPQLTYMHHYPVNSLCSLITTENWRDGTSHPKLLSQGSGWIHGTRDYSSWEEPWGPHRKGEHAAQELNHLPKASVVILFPVLLAWGFYLCVCCEPWCWDSVDTAIKTILNSPQDTWELLLHYLHLVSSVMTLNLPELRTWLIGLFLQAFILVFE